MLFHTSLIKPIFCLFGQCQITEQSQMGKNNKPFFVFVVII